MGYDRANRHADTFDWCQVVRTVVRAEFPAGAEILDVGAGFGKYRILLPEYPNMDAVEVWEPYIEEEGLREKYRTVYHADIHDHIRSTQWRPYDLVICGDVLEHMARPQARRLVRFLARTCGEVFAVVPYEYPQGAEHGNAYQRHLQPDLTPEIMAVEYPQLSLAEIEYRDGRQYRGLYRTSK